MLQAKLSQRDLRQIILSVSLLASFIAIATFCIPKHPVTAVFFGIFVFLFAKGIALRITVDRWNRLLRNYHQHERDLFIGGLPSKHDRYYQNSYLIISAEMILDFRFWHYRDLITDKILIYDVECHDEFISK